MLSGLILMCAANDLSLCFSMTSTYMFENYDSCMSAIHSKVVDIEDKRYIDEYLGLEFKVKDFICVDWSSTPI
jgi:hypothetical protein